MSAGSNAVEEARIAQAVLLARALQTRARSLQTTSERRQQAELDRMLKTPDDKVTLIQLTDQAFRSSASARTAEHLTHILDVQGVPRFFSPLDRALLRGFQTFGGWLPGVAVPLVKDHMRHETANVVLPAETELLTDHLRNRTRDGLRMNLNFLGEALAGEDEAARRLEKYLEALQLPEVEVVSVKISTLYSQISALAREHTLRALCDRLEILYREAAHLRFTRLDGTTVPKFIYLDMEEYRDLHLTAQAFMRTLDRPGLKEASAGIALQAYIPDSAMVQKEINAWARQRVAKGGASVTIRLVKGANMEMERVEATQHDWPQAPFKTKRETDANYKKMLRESLTPANLAAVRVGVASHNLFDLAYALLLAAEINAGDRVQFEMLEGMANHQRRALREQTQNLLLYAPACRKEDFLNAIGYLIRRLDENTGPENFLSHAFKLEAGSAEWERLERGFRESFAIQASDSPRRTQNRLMESHDVPRAEMSWNEFRNEPDTDWSLPQNSSWAEEIVARREPRNAVIPLVIGGGEISPGPSGTQNHDFATGVCRDPSRPGLSLARYRIADEAEADRAVACAREASVEWRARSVNDRGAVLERVAQEIRQARADLIWAALANGGKTVGESDPEVSEAVDFVEFYRAAARYFFEWPGIRASGRGVVVVAPPWNFPIAIPCGGIAAALAAGNAVILKPASDAVLIAYELCQCFWRAGLSRRVLQFVPCPGSGAGMKLATHPEVDAVILTGGTTTALSMLRAKPDLRLFGETGGKNAAIITALSDRELAIKHVVHSAFSHSGQKCSATSLLLLEGEVYDDPVFKRMLCDSVKSLPAGPAWELHTRVGPLIRPPAGELEEALKTLEPGESWAVMPRQIGENPNLWSPGVKWGVKPRSVAHVTEFFGPLLAVMRFERLDEAISLVNETGYGLTSGLHSLDDREKTQWVAGVLAGNLYLNRGTTGAVVLRQPFGGLGKSCFGPGLKAGGPNYVAQFMRFEVEQLSREPHDQPAVNEQLEAFRQSFRKLVEGLRETDRRILSPELLTEIHESFPRLPRAISSYDRGWRDEFSRQHDHFLLPGQDNFRRYLPFQEIRVRVMPGDGFFDICARVCAARVTGARVLTSREPGGTEEALRLIDELTTSWGGSIEFIEETDQELGDVLRAEPPHARGRLRYAAPGRVPSKIRAASAASGQWIADEPVIEEGRIELLWYLREQSVCHDYHRYGNLGGRTNEKRAEPA